MNIRPAKKGFAAFMRRLVRHERGFYQVCLTYGVAVSLLTLAVPVAVQMVINTVANTAQQLSLVVVCGLVVLMLSAAVLLYALQIYVMELFCRRFFARNVAEMAVGVSDVTAAGFQRANGFEFMKRFYEIIAIQKAVPNLIIAGFSMTLQMLVGLVVVAFYHPFLLAFNVLFILICVFIWRFWHNATRDAARELSVAKYTMAGWLGHYAQTSDALNDAQMQEAWRQTNMLTNNYIDARRAFFQNSFAQTIGFLALYVCANAGLLGLGGWLVIQQQLTLGQLAAAEIILSAVFFSLTRVGYFLRLYYETCVSAEKLDEFFADTASVLSMEKRA
jgi:putative ABC transport system ATP-binding protein